ncbi:hypothetical protein ABE583_05925 [Stenotrophomonas sp. TWI143]|uniref:hypothetical protein n=1 Tax=Stenotrophomonas sp. TWI143 TaxID=3136771 RepID=UPI00320A455E
MIDAEPSFGYLTALHCWAWKITGQRIFRRKVWQVHKRPLSQGSSIQAGHSRAEDPDHRWATELCRVLRGKDGWLSLIDGIL